LLQVCADFTDGGDVAANGDGEVGQKLFADRADGNAGGSLASRGAFEGGAQVTVTVLDGAGQVSVAGAWGGERVNRFAAPLRIVTILD
jgi:hypothetical protein